MANNNAIFNAVLSGATGGFQQRWLTQQNAAAYSQFKTDVALVATAVDSLITPTTITEAQANLIQSIANGIFSGRYPQSNFSTWNSIAQAIVALYNSLSAELLPVTGGGGPPSGPAGGDLGGTYPDPLAVAITENGGIGTRLDFGVIADQTLVGRVGTTLASIALGAALSLSAGTLAVASASNTSPGIVPQTNGTLGQVLTSAAGAGALTWGTDFGAQNLTSTGNLLIGAGPRASTVGLIRVGSAKTIIAAQNSGAADRVVLSFGITSTDAITLGDVTQGSYRILSSGAQDAYIASTRQYSLGAAVINLRPDGATPFVIQATAITMINFDSVSATRNIGFFSGGTNFQSGNRIFFVTTATLGPSANPTGGVFWYAEPSTNSFIWINPAGVMPLGNTTFATTITGAAGSALVGTSNCLRWSTNQLGFYNTVPVTQPADLGAFVDNTTGTPSGTLTMVDVGAAFNQANINNNFATLISWLTGGASNLRTSIIRALGLSA